MESPLIDKSDEILSGTPVFHGTRVPVRTLIDYLSGGDTLDDFVEDFPTVSRQQALQFLETAEQVMVAAAVTKQLFTLPNLL